MGESAGITSIGSGRLRRCVSPDVSGMSPALHMISARGPLFMLAGVVIGLALPAVAEVLRPYVVPISVATVVISMLRVEPARLVATLRRPYLVGLVGIFILLVLPALTFLAALTAGAPGWLITGLTFASAAPPLSSAAAFAILVRIDPALVTGLSTAATFAAPASVWLVTTSFPGLGQGVELGAMVLRLAFIVVGALLAALAVRRVVGAARLAAWGPVLDALTIVLVTLIAIGVMHDIGIALRATPGEWFVILLLTAVVSLSSLALALVAFWPAGRDEAIAAALCASVKNMALMVAAVLGTVDPRISLVVITAQFPIFLMPLLMRPLFRKLGNAGGRP